MEQTYRQPGHPAAFSGETQLLRHYPKENAKHFLSTVDSYTRHRAAKKPRFRNPVYVYDTRELIQVDLADVGALADYNSNTKFLLLAIDTFSRKAWLKPLVSKSGLVVTAAMRSILDEMGEKKVIRILTDNGKEFLNAPFQSLLKKYNIRHNTSTSEVKAPHIERFTGTLKRLMHMYMTENETRKYLDQLDALLITYNSRWHRAIDMTPNEADKPEHRDKVIAILNRKRYGPIAQRRGKIDPQFKIGDIVRLRIHGSVFRKGHEETFTGEMFRIKNVLNNLPITQYEVETYNGDEVIKGSFYASELQLCSNPLFKVEKVISTRRRNGQLQHFVKWLHFDDQYNEWINASDIEQEFHNG